MWLYFFMFKSLHVKCELMHFDFLLCFSLQGTRESIIKKKKSQVLVSKFQGYHLQAVHIEFPLRVCFFILRKWNNGTYILEHSGGHITEQNDGQRGR